MRPATGVLGGLLATVLAVALTPVAPHTESLIGPLMLTVTEDRELVQTSRMIRSMQRDGNLRLVEVTSDPLVPSRTHQRFTQLHRNVRVLGGGLSVQTERGYPTSIFGHVYPNITVNTEPELSVQDVVALADRGGSRLLSPPELAVVLDTADVYRLVYHVRTFGMNGLRVSEIDATTGAIIGERNALNTQGQPSPCLDCAVGEGLGIKGDRKKLSVRSVEGTFVTDDGLRPARVSTYDMRGDWVRAFDVLVGLAQLTDADLAQDPDNVWQDGVSVDGHVGSGWTLDYLYHRFGREGLDGDNGPLVAIVHPVDRADFFTVPGSVASLFHLNAFYCGACGAVGNRGPRRGTAPEQMLGGTG